MTQLSAQRRDTDADPQNLFTEKNMNAVTITDHERDRKELSFDIKDIFRLLEYETRNSQWQLTNIEIIGPSAESLYELVDNGAIISGDFLLSLVEGINQTIDGLFEGYRVGSQRPWLRVRAVDGVAFDVESDESAIIDKIRMSFRDVKDLPNRP